MNIGCTQMHPVTLAAIIIELVLLGAQLAFFLNHPADKARLWHLLLLVLLIVLNIIGGLFPDPSFSIPVYVQNIIAYGVGFLVAGYFPFYFYKAFDLKLLRFHAFYGVPLCFILPYLAFFVISYSIHEDMDFTIRYGVIIPFFYSLVLLVAILRAIRMAYRENRNRKFYLEEIAVYCAFAPWSLMAIIVYFKFGQLTEVLFTNLGFMAVTGIFIFTSVRQHRSTISQLKDISVNGFRPELFGENCIRSKFTVRETEVARLLHEGCHTGEIASRLYIAERTVTTHIQNMMAKTNTHSRLELLRKLEAGIFDRDEPI